MIHELEHYVVSPSHLYEMSRFSLNASEAISSDDLPFLLLRIDQSARELTDEQRDTLCKWLGRQPCPVIALSEADAADPLAAACDLVVEDIARAEPILAQIKRSPQAAMVLVQTLRITSCLPVAQALTVESLAYATLQSGGEFKRWLQSRTPGEGVAASDDGPAVEMERNGNELILHLNRPSRRNSLSVAMRDALVDALGFVLADDSLTSVRISGNGKCFSVGGELEEFGEFSDPASAHAIRSLRLPAAMLAQCAERVEVHLHGACIGSGVEIPAFAHRITAHPKTFFQLPEIRFGLIPGAGGCVSIPRRIGRQKTAYMALSTQRIDARTALDWGLVDELVG